MAIFCADEHQVCSASAQLHPLFCAETQRACPNRNQPIYAGTSWEVETICCFLGRHLAPNPKECRSILQDTRSDALFFPEYPESTQEPVDAWNFLVTIS